MNNLTPGNDEQNFISYIINGGFPVALRMPAFHAGTACTKLGTG